MVQKSPQMKEYDLVWTIDHREKRGFHHLVSVKKCHFGSDDNVRSCDFPTQPGLVSRPAIKLILLFDDDGCVSPQEKHRAADEKVYKSTTEKLPKHGVLMTK